MKSLPRRLCLLPKSKVISSQIISYLWKVHINKILIQTKNDVIARQDETVLKRFETIIWNYVE